MLSYTEHDNAQAVEISVSGKVSTEEFDRLAENLEAFIKRHGKVRILERITDLPQHYGTTSNSACVT